MKRAFAAPLFAFAVLVLSLHSAPSAQAQTITLSLDDPFQTVAAPPAGVTTLPFTGTFSIPTGFFFQTVTLLFPFQVTGEILTGNLLPTGYGPANNGGTITGTLFTINIPAGASPGLYDRNGGLVNPVTFGAVASDASGNQITASVPYSVNVTSASAVPEPASMALLGAGILPFLAGLRRRRRQKGLAEEPAAV